MSQNNSKAFNKLRKKVSYGKNYVAVNLFFDGTAEDINDTFSVSKLLIACF